MSPKWAGHPRVGGEHTESEWLAGNTSGSSPRGRGTHHACRPCHAHSRVIPAWAGNTREHSEFET